MSTDSESKAPTAPPYISFKTLTNLLERLEQTHLPPRIDRSYLDGMSGGYQTQVIAALRWLDLIGENGEARPVLVALATTSGQRPQMIGELLHSRYPSVFAISNSHGTQGQLEEEFRKFGVSGSTLRKAIAFFLHAARYAEIPVSAHFKIPPARNGDRPPARRKRETRGNAGQTPPAPLPPAQDPTAELRNRYIEMLLDKVKGQEEMDANLLDRIENLLGFRASRNENGTRDPLSTGAAAPEGG